MADHDAEGRDIDVRGVVAGAGLIVLGIAASLAAGWLVLVWQEASPGGPSALGTLPATGSPALQSAPRSDLAAFRREKQALIESYGWVDRARGRVRIPVELAIEQMIEETRADAGQAPR